MVFKPLIARFIVGSLVSLVASAGAVTSAIALPTNDPLTQNPERSTPEIELDVAQDIDVPETEMRVPATVTSIDSEQGFIRVNLEDDRVEPSVDTIYLSGDEIRTLGINEGEELTVVYQNEQAVALIRGNEIVQLQTGGGFVAEEDETITPTPPQAQIEPEDTPSPTQPSQPFEQTTPSPGQQDPIPGLW